MASFHLDKRGFAKCNYIFKVNKKELLNLLLTHILASILQDLVDFISLECVISFREAFFFDRNCKLKNVANSLDSVIIDFLEN